ncbi:MAG: hypothetical protein R6W96_05490, partial [Clostridia bacterium]
MRHDALNRISKKAAGMLSVLLFLTACSSGVPAIYRELTGFKGIELYVWENAPAKDLCFGFLEGTNRNKTEEDFRFLYRGVDIAHVHVELIHRGQRVLGRALVVPVYAALDFDERVAGEAVIRQTLD